MNHNENFSENYKQEEEIDLKKIIYLLLRQWYWFVIFGVLGFGAGFIYHKLTKQQYSVSTTILVPEKSGGLDMNALFEGGLSNQASNNIYNQIEIIKSYYTVNQTLKNLNWQTSWYKKDLIWRGIYKSEPFDVIESKDFINPRGIAIHIKTKSNNKYNISVEGTINHNNVETDINFNAEASYNLPFTNEYFNFTLFKKEIKPIPEDEEYFFVFNDLNSATRSYQGRLSAELKDKFSDIIMCSMEGEQPVKEGEFLNELISVYVDGKMNFQNEAQWRSLDFINRQLAGFSDSLNSAATEFTKFRSENKIIDLGAEGTRVMDKLKEIESERTINQRQLDYFQNLLAYMNNDDDIDKIVSPSVVGIQDASLNALVLKLGELYNRRQLVSFSAKENNPTLVLIDRELAQTRSRLNENLRNLIENATKSINSLKEYQASISVQLNKLPEKEQQMINIQRQFDLTNEIYTFMLQKRAETNITLASSIPDVQVIDIARPETAEPIGLSRSIILIMGTMLGLALPLIFFMLINFFDNRIRTQEDVENNTKLPILGNIMHSPNISDLTVSENPKSNIAESFRALRTNMQFMLSGAQGKVISIHSTNPGEGKSFTSINLATILAMNNKKVLLVGADMRKPRAHKVFNLSNEKGLSTYLIGYDTIDQIILPTKIDNLFFLPSGPIPPNPAEILGKPEMKELIDQVRKTFDYIILDNAPVALVTDGFIVSQFSDLNIFILRYGYSHKYQIELINQYATKKMINHIAIVVNDVKTNAFGYTYYKYYQYEAYQKAYYADEEHELKTRRKKKTKKA